MEPISGCIEGSSSSAFTSVCLGQIHQISRTSKPGLAELGVDEDLVVAREVVVRFGFRIN